MPRKYISKFVRKEVERRAKGSCEYCKFLQKYSPDPFACEHIIPLVHGGTNDIDNLAHSCLGCNSVKHTFIEAIDPKSQNLAPLFHPRKDSWSSHFSWTTDALKIKGLTPTGRATINQLKTNRSALVAFRKLLLMTGEHPPK